MMIELHRLSEAPSEGFYIVYTRQAVLTGRYKSLSEIQDILDNNSKDGILESHFFNNEKEYRNILSTSRRHQGYIEYVADFNTDEENDIFVDRTVLDRETVASINNSGNDGDEIRVLKVLNKVSYDENGMAYIDDYRLVMEVE